MATSFRDELLTVWETLATALPAARFEQGPGYVVVSYPRFPAAAMNAVWAWGGGATAVAELPERLAEIEAEGVSPGVIVFNGEAPELEREARRLGYAERHEIPGMVATASAFDLAEAVELEIVVARESEECATASDVAAAGFGFPRDWVEDLYSPDLRAIGVTVYLGLVGKRPVTTALAFRTEGSVGVFNVATPPEERGRGYGAAVTSRAAADGFATGAGSVWLQASRMGFGVYQRLGFETVSTAGLWARPDADTARV